ncbi:MAG: hypothetical protein WBG37_13700 [Desulfobacterales bacterium]
MWTIGLTQSGNELGLTENEVSQLPAHELNIRLAGIESQYRKNGAHYVAKGIWECLPLIDQIQDRLTSREHP